MGHPLKVLRLDLLVRPALAAKVGTATPAATLAETLETTPAATQAATLAATLETTPAATLAETLMAILIATPTTIPATTTVPEEEDATTDLRPVQLTLIRIT